MYVRSGFDAHTWTLEDAREREERSHEAGQRTRGTTESCTLAATAPAHRHAVHIDVVGKIYKCA